MAGILLARNSSKIIGVFVNDHEKYEGHTLDDFFIASSLNFLSTEIESNGWFMMAFAWTWNASVVFARALPPVRQIFC